MKKIRIGSGAGYSGDRLEPALDLMNNGELDYIIFECLAERTIALAQQQKLKSPDTGYNPFFKYRMRKILPLCQKNKVKIITNMGAANPIAALNEAVLIAKELGLNLKFAAVTGDDVTDRLNRYNDSPIIEFDGKVNDIKSKIISANAYIGAEGITSALNQGADVIITGRVSDPALVVGPLVYEFGNNSDDFIGRAIMTGHLLECAAQITGGYFSDPGYKDVPDLWNLGYPIAEFDATGTVVISKLKNTGGVIDLRTCKEQLIYEIHNPAEYITPDGIADYTTVQMRQIAVNEVEVSGAIGHGKPKSLKVSLGYKDGYIGEGEISYGGSNALEKAKLAASIIEHHIADSEYCFNEVRIDYIGYNSLFGDKLSPSENNNFPEIRLRIAARTEDEEAAKYIGDEVEALYTTGPSGGGGATRTSTDIISIASILIPRKEVEQKVTIRESK